MAPPFLAMLMLPPSADLRADSCGSGRQTRLLADSYGVCVQAGRQRVAQAGKPRGRHVAGPMHPCAHAPMQPMPQGAAPQQKKSVSQISQAQLGGDLHLAYIFNTTTLFVIVWFHRFGSVSHYMVETLFNRFCDFLPPFPKRKKKHYRGAG